MLDTLRFIFRSIRQIFRQNSRPRVWFRTLGYIIVGILGIMTAIVMASPLFELFK